MKKICLAILLCFLILFSESNLVFATEYIDGGIYKDETAPLITDTFTYIKTYDGTVEITKAITAFNFNGLTPSVTGTVNEESKTIALTVPYGTDVTALVPTISHTGVSISPNTGVPVDFTKPVEYTVTAADSTTQKYTVTVTVAANSAKAITVFDFSELTPNVIGTVNEASKTIALTVPYGTDVTKLVPMIIHTGASVSPNTEVAQDFTNPVEYTVTAADSTTQKYTVTVSVVADSAKAITAFDFSKLTPNVIGIVNETSKTIALTVPYGTDVSALVPAITHTGASVSPDTGVAQDFTNPVEYTVTAADSTTQKYTVTVTVAANVYMLTYTAGTGGTITGTATQTVNSGANGSAVTAIPNSGYHFVGWSDGVTTATRMESNVTGNITVTANFARNTITLPSDTSVTTPTPVVEILINNDKVYFASSDIKVENGKKKTTIILDDEKLINSLNEENDGSTIIIPVSNNSDIAIGQLSAQTIEYMLNKDMNIVVKSDNISYVIPAKDIDIDNISKRIGSLDLKDIKVNISVSKSSEEIQTIANNTATMNNYKLVINPVDFEITFTNGSNTVHVSQFNDYVARTVILPEGIDINTITTGVLLNEGGTFSHVPTVVQFIDGKYHARINSLTNSTYTLIWNSVTFKDAEKHWSKNYVNDVGSRLIDDGVGNSNFAPKRAITRAEFASMVVKALGLKGTNVQHEFNDVKESDPSYYYIYTAYEYGIMDGYSNGNFGPQDLITREQAMTMLVKAMDVAGMDVKVSKTDIESQLNQFKDSDKISLNARQSAAICVKNVIFVGDKKGMLYPNGNLTRGESATVIIRLLKKAGLI